MIKSQNLQPFSLLHLNIPFIHIKPSFWGILAGFKVFSKEIVFSDIELRHILQIPFNIWLKTMMHFPHGLNFLAWEFFFRDMSFLVEKESIKLQINLIEIIFWWKRYYKRLDLLCITLVFSLNLYISMKYVMYLIHYS